MRAFINFSCIALLCILANTVQAGKISKEDLKSSDKFDYGAHYESLKAGKLIKKDFAVGTPDSIPVTCAPSSSTVLNKVILSPSNPQVHSFWKKKNVLYNEPEVIEAKEVETKLFECKNEEKLLLPFFVAIFRMTFKDESKPEFNYAQTYALVDKDVYARVWITDLEQMKIEETE